MKRLKKVLKKLKKVIRQPVLRVLPGQIAFFLVLSIFPLLTLVGVIASIFSISVDTIVDMIATALPLEVTEVLAEFIQGKGFDMNIGIFMIIGFYLASNGTHSIILAANMLYKVESEDFIKRRIRSIFLIILLLLLFVFLIAFLTFGNTIVKFILNLVSSEQLAGLIYKFFILLKWPFAMLVIFFNIKLLYTICPDVKLKSKYTTKGAIFTTLGWTVATAIYTYYVSHFTNYDIFYAGISNIIVLMIWVYILSYILVIGIAINVNGYEYNLENDI